MAFQKKGTYYEGFATRLFETRKNRGMSQIEVARQSGLSLDNKKIWRFERDLQWPTDEEIDKLSNILGVTSEFLKTGEDNVQSTIQTPEVTGSIILKKAYSNHEGYNDPTAAKAIAIAMSDGAVFEPGDIVSSDRNKYLIINKLDNYCRYLVIKVDTFRFGDSDTVCTVKNGETPYYINLAFFWSVDLSKGYKKKFTVSEISFKVILSKFKKLFTFLPADPVAAPIVKEKKEEPVVSVEAPDEASTIFADSVKYFSEKKNLAVEIPEKVLTLKEAITFAKKVDQPLDELVKDHTNDRKFDKICELEAELAKLKAEIGL